MSARLILEIPCRHGYVECLATIEYPLNMAANANDFIPEQCPGGICRELYPGELVEIGQHDWCRPLEGLHGSQCTMQRFRVAQILDALLSEEES